jgi:DNA/RNA endonuclease YhcR with UshA esterase domain
MRHPITALLLLCAPLTGCPAEDPDGMLDARIDIADARALEVDEEATIEGYVTVAPGTFNSAIGDQGFAIQDETGGIYVSIPDALDFEIGEHVRVSGRLAQVAQFTTLIADTDDVEVQTGDTLDVEPLVVATGEVGETNEGELVEVTGMVTQMVMDDSPYGFKVYVDDGSGEIQVFVHIVGGVPVIDLALLSIGEMITTVGLSAQYEATYEVTPRMTDDLQVGP